MNRTLTRILLTCLLTLPLLASAANVRGTLNSYSIKGKVLVVNGTEYTVDIENLNITYNGAYYGTDGLKQGIQVQLYFNENETGDGGATISRLEILTKRPDMES